MTRNKKMARHKKRHSHNAPILQQISAPIASIKKTNGHANGQAINGQVVDLGINSRSFETRFTPRYEVMPDFPEGLELPHFSESANKILKERYLLKGGNLEAVETIAERFWHIAYDIASADFDFGSDKKEVLDLARKFYGTMIRQEFLPNSPTIMNAGKQNQLQYSACFVLPVADSIPEIFDTMKYAALIHQTGGGTGFAFSRLRPAGSMVKRSGGVASGPVSFLRVYDAATQAIKQGGTRRGANMGILRVDHPDVLEFIRSKAELDEQNKPVYEGVAPLLPDDSARQYLKTLLLDRQISNFNISVAITKPFMDSYYKAEDFDLVDPHTQEVTGRLNAKDVFEEMVDRAWHTGDPGCIFIDRINASPSNPVPDIETIESTNPCGEQPLAAWDACNLGSINLGKFVLADGTDVDWDSLKEATRTAVHFLDNVVQTNPFTIEEIYTEVHKNRRIGLGVMGWADMLFKLMIPYDSQEALDLAEKVMGFINDEGHKESEDLAAKRGPFPNWENSIYSHKYNNGESKRHPSFAERPQCYAYASGKPLRNSTVTTIAPTGTISIIADCSSGVEPVFALAYLHRAKGDGGKTGNEIRTLTIANKTFTEIAEREGFHSEGLAQKVMDHGSVSGVDDVPADWQRVFVTAPEIAPEFHVKMQAAFQRYTDNGVSKTINLPNSATIDDIRKAYLMAWETGCSGITVYRDGSKAVQVLNVSSTLNKKSEEPAVLTQESSVPWNRPSILRGRTYKMNTPVGEAFVTINRDDKDQPFEVFVTIGRAGMHTSADAEAIGRLVSLALRVTRPSSTEIAKKIVQQLRGIGGTSTVGFGKDRVMSLADAIAKALAEEIALIEESASSLQTTESEPIPLDLAINAPGKDDVVVKQLAIGSGIQADLCPECGDATFVFEEGCKKCHSCGYSMC
jgi:ribonucleoside-diphosphate reductase alpha chain